jgi:hypothetical protein
MKKAIFNVSALAVLLVPAVAFAQNFTYFDNVVGHGLVYLKTAITVLTVLMTVYFLYNVLRFIMAKEAADQATYRKAMINGLIGLFVATAVWGIISLAGSITGVNTRADTPTVTCPPGTHPDPANTASCTGGLF